MSFYRWHVPDPIMFERDLRVTIQQIGAMFFPVGQEEQMAAYEKTNPVAGTGWNLDAGPAMLAWGIVERVDDYCATSYVYCTEPQPVPRLDLRGCFGRHRTPRLRAAQSDRATELGRGSVQRLSRRGLSSRGDVGVNGVGADQAEHHPAGPIGVNDGGRTPHPIPLGELRLFGRVDLDHLVARIGRGAARRLRHRTRHTGAS